VLAEYEIVKPPSKLHPLHKGPLRVINISRNGHIYTLQDLVTNEINLYFFQSKDYEREIEK
jgi:hypothetical protein